MFNRVFFEHNFLLDEWLLSLPEGYCTAWIQIVSSCDEAGVWAENWHVMSMVTKGKVGETEESKIKMLNLFAGKIQRISEKKLWYKGLIAFQQTRLSFKKPPHRGIWRSIAKHGLIEHLDPGVLPESFDLEEIKSHGIPLVLNKKGDMEHVPCSFLPPEPMPLIPGENAVAVAQIKPAAQKRAAVAKKPEQPTSFFTESVKLCQIWKAHLDTYGHRNRLPVMSEKGKARTLAEKWLRTGEYSFEFLENCIHQYFETDKGDVSRGYHKQMETVFGPSMQFLNYGSADNKVVKVTPPGQQPLINQSKGEKYR